MFAFRSLISTSYYIYCTIMALKVENADFIMQGPHKYVDIHDKGLGWSIYENMIKHKENIMQICSQTGVQERFGDVLSRVIRVALEMKNRGVKSKDVVCMCSSNHLNSCVPVLASIFLNCKIACLDPTLSESDTKHLLNQVEPKILFIGQEAEELISKVLDDDKLKPIVVSFGNNPNKFEPFVNFLKQNPKEEHFKPIIATSLLDTILIFFSSGTTGLPKGICLPHYSVMKQMTETGSTFGSIMSFASHYWISTFYLMYTAIQMGNPRIIIKEFDVKKAWDAIDVFKPFGMFAAPCQMLELLDGKRVPSGKDISGFKMIMTAGHTVSPEQLDFIRSQFPHALIATGYGQTEAAGGLLSFQMGSMEGIKAMMIKRGSCGTILPGITYKVVDVDTGKLCGPNQKGELHVKSDFFMSGYYNVDSSSAWDKDGFMKTGDVVYYDADKYFYIVDRTKEMFKYKSWHVVPAKLEAVICKHPDVLNAIVIGIPHELDGEHPCAAVTLKEGATVTMEELKKFADDQLDEKQKLRGGLYIINEFPTTPSGKISRRLVKEYVLGLQK